MVFHVGQTDKRPDEIANRVFYCKWVPYKNSQQSARNIRYCKKSLLVIVRISPTQQGLAFSRDIETKSILWPRASMTS